MIIFFHLLNDFSGSPKVLRDVIVELDKHHEIQLFVGGDNVGFLSGFVNRTKNYYYRRSNNKILTLINYLFSQFLLFLVVFKYRKQKPIIYINTILPFGAAIAGKFIGAEVIYHIHESSIRPILLDKFLRLIVKLTADKAIFVSKYLANEFSLKSTVNKIIYNALDANFENKARNFKYAECQNNNQFNILMVCSLKTYKGIEQFLSLAKRFINDETVKFDLVLNASDSEIDSYFKGVGFSSNINIHSCQTDLHSFYSKASLVMNLSLVDQWVETFGLTLLEAMSYGIPVIAPPIGGPSELVDDGDTGFLISSYDIDLLEDKIKYIKNNNSYRMFLSNNAKIKARKFGIETFNSSLVSFINHGDKSELHK